MGQEQPTPEPTDEEELERTQPSEKRRARRLDWRPPDFQTDAGEPEPTPPPVRRVARPGARRRRPPTEGAPAWVVGLGIGALVAVILLLVVAFVLSRRSAQPEPSPTPVVVTPTPTLVPRPTATALPAVSSTSDAGETEEAPTTAPTSETITVGGYVRVVAPAGLSLRQSASTGGALVQVLDLNATLEVIGGPTEADGYTWWQLRTLDEGNEGWSAVGLGDEVYLEPTQAP